MNAAESLQTINGVCILFGVVCLTAAVVAGLWALHERDERLRLERENRRLRRAAPWAYLGDGR